MPQAPLGSNLAHNMSSIQGKEHRGRRETERGCGRAFGRCGCRAVYAAVRHCATHLRPDVLAAMQTARADETQARALSVLDCLLENAHIGQTDGVPICQDTGTCWVRLEIGEELSVPGNILSRVNDAWPAPTPTAGCA